LNKRDILFPLEVMSDGRSRPKVEQPLVSHSFHSGIHSVLASVGEGSAEFNTRRSIRSFGILLLELCFGQCIEKHRRWKEYLNPDGIANKDTYISVAEIWSDEVESHDPILADPINRCVSCFFGKHSSHIGYIM
jgi:hypothetical protein